MQKQVYDTCKASGIFSPFENIIGYYEAKDEQIPNTYSQYGNIAMETLTVKVFTRNGKSDRIKIISCIYLCTNLQKRYVLKRHKDRFSCEISTTMNLGGDDWPIYLEPSGETGKKGIKVDLKPGDMLVYSGCE